MTAVDRNMWKVLTEMISNSPHNTNQAHESAKPWIAELRKTFPCQNCRHYWLLQMTNKIKYLFALTDKGIEFVFSSFLYINLVIMFLFVLEVRLHSIGQIHFCLNAFCSLDCRGPGSIWGLIDHCSFGHSLRSCEIKAWKISVRPERDSRNPWPLRYWYSSGLNFFRL